eukprot:3065695-Pleurochrysis_carterae.AAC.1
MSKAGSRPRIEPKTAPGYPAKLMRVHLPATAVDLNQRIHAQLPSIALLCTRRDIPASKASGFSKA